MQPQRRLSIKGTYNMRDLGGYAIAGGETRWGRLLRADALHRIDAEGMQAMVACGIVTVIDLRNGDELIHQPNPFTGHPSVTYHNVALLDGLAPALMREGDVLLDLYRLALTHRQPAIAQVLQIIADAPRGAVLFHCTAGKDRTGIIAALLLSLADVDPRLIVEDYALSEGDLAPIMAEITAGAVARGADPVSFQRLLASAPATMTATLAFIGTEFGSVPAYIRHIGLDDATMARLRNRLLGEF
tara:strand:- start:609 stop:1340 length:732 start_codon:yes stop_codon:yes gene_type:complete